MNILKLKVRRPVRRQGAEIYLLITLLSFASSVTLTRLFLELAGYPQLGGGGLHIAHVLWGGLLLFFASLLPLLVANRWAYRAGAVLSGVGVGLFIDEVGKFITQNNDYFFPAAAPIVYSFFLLTVLLYLRIRSHTPREARSELYWAFDSMEEVLEHDLDPIERHEIEERLQYVADQEQEPVLQKLARDLLDFMHSDVQVVPIRLTIFYRLTAFGRLLERRWVRKWRVKAVLIGGLFALSLVSLFSLMRALPVGFLSGSLEKTLIQLYTSGQVRSASGLSLFSVRLALESSVGLLLLVSAGLLVWNRDHPGSSLAYLSLLLSLTAVDLLVFYFDQFSTILMAFFQFILLLLVIYYRRRFLDRSSTNNGSPNAGAPAPEPPAHADKPA